MLNRVHLLKSNKLKPLIDFKIKNVLLSRLISWNPRRKKTANPLQFIHNKHLRWDKKGHTKAVKKKCRTWGTSWVHWVYSSTHSAHSPICHNTNSLHMNLSIFKLCCPRYLGWRHKVCCGRLLFLLFCLINQLIYWSSNKSSSYCINDFFSHLPKILLKCL